MIDWNAVAQSLVEGAAWGTGFAIPFFVGITWMVLKILSHPSVRNIAKAAGKLGEKGDVWTELIRGGFSLLKPPPP